MKKKGHPGANLGQWLHPAKGKGKSSGSKPMAKVAAKPQTRASKAKLAQVMKAFQP